MQYKLRYIVNSKSNGKTVQGITIPNEIAVFFEGCFFSIQKSGTSIILSSGCNITPTLKQVIKYKFEDCRL